MMNPVGSAFMSPGPAIDPREMVEQEDGLDVGIEPGAGLGYAGMDGDARIISREIYQGKTFDDWDDMEANVRRLARKAGFKVVKVRDERETGERESDKERSKTHNIKYITKIEDEVPCRFEMGPFGEVHIVSRCKLYALIHMSRLIPQCCMCLLCGSLAGCILPRTHGRPLFLIGIDL